MLFALWTSTASKIIDLEAKKEKGTRKLTSSSVMPSVSMVLHFSFKIKNYSMTFVITVMDFHTIYVLLSAIVTENIQFIS